MTEPLRRPTAADALRIATGHLDPAAFTTDACCGSCGQMLPNMDGTLGPTT